MTKLEETHRVVWQQFLEPDPRTGRLVVKVVWPRYVPKRRSWWDRQKLIDLMLAAGFAILFTMALLSGLR